MILVDPPAWPGHGRLWSHLVSDVSYAELHAFAARLGVPRRGFERDHYDVPEHLYADAVRLGAVPVGSRELVARLTAAGLRRRKGGGAAEGAAPTPVPAPTPAPVPVPSSGPAG
ncbi:DUF4031 domain-containing protein [Streptomyces sp. NPDC001380]|uniref:DUF4031 domain-containing protein n=1 Tax=Streptomyces sp. NPDC001380 TaxID=3364566 RepID=UPI0036883E67